MGWADRETAWVSLSQSPAWVTASRRHRCGAASLSLSVSHSRSVASGSRSLTFLSSFFFLFFPLVFQVLLPPFGFGLLRAEIFSFFFFFFFVVVDWHGLWPYELCSGLAGWWARGRRFMPDDGLGEGGAGAKILGGPKPLFFFFGKILLAKKFFFWAQEGLGPP